LNIAITGASGFIGTRLSSYLHECGHHVVALVRSNEKAQAINKKGIATKICDITDQSSLKDAFKDMQVVIHLAALFNHPEASWDDYYRVNVGGTKNVLETALQTGIKRVVHCSTGGVVTGGGSPPYSEQTPYAAPAWDKYETTKMEGEKAALDFFGTQDLEVVIIRPTQPYGPGDVSKAKFYRMVERGVIVNPGKTKKHLIFIDDLCRAFEMTAMHQNIKSEIFIIGGQTAIELKTLVRIVAENLKVSPPKIVIPANPMKWLCIITEHLCNSLGMKPILYRRSMDFFTKSVEFDVNKANEALGFQSRVDVYEGVSKTAAWYREAGLL
jgi:nucleoside-diphosphate-sugar epimerase